MSLLTVAQAVSKEVGMEVPPALVGSTERELVELLHHIQDAAKFVANGHDWQVLKRVHTITGDGTTEDWDLPTDYDRMTAKSQVWSSSLETPLSPISDADKWLGLDVQSFDFVINAWTIYGGEMHIKPALATGVTAKFFYVSNLITTSSGGTNQIAFAADTDTFRIDEKLLEYCAIWRWKAAKGQAYAEKMSDYNQRLARVVYRDRGSRMINIGEVRMPADVTIAYPEAIEP